MIPHVQVNLYQEGVAADGVTPTLTLVDHTETTSFDDWAQGFRKDVNGNPIHAADGTSYLPNISCPGQTKNDAGTISDPFYYALQDQPSYLDLYGNSTRYRAPSTVRQPVHPCRTTRSSSATTACITGTSCSRRRMTACTASPASPRWIRRPASPPAPTARSAPPNPSHSTDPYRFGTPMLPAGKYVVEVVVPPGYELVKEEDKNILIGDNFIAPATQQFGGLGPSSSCPTRPRLAPLTTPTTPRTPPTAWVAPRFPATKLIPASR